MSEIPKANYRHDIMLGLLVTPALLFTLIFFVYPIGKILAFSFGADGYTLEHYKRLFQTSLYLRVIWETWKIGLVVTICCVAVGYPLALFLNKIPDTRLRPALVVVCLPLWMSLLARNYAWMMVLQTEGMINKGLTFLGLVSEPLPLLHNRFSVVVVMVHALLPFAVLPIYASIRNVKSDVLDAAQTLGATPSKVFLRVLLPLTLPGVGTGAFSTFILALGYFITPTLLGGRGDVTIAMLIDVQANRLLDWGFASALSVALLVMTAWAFAALSKTLDIYAAALRR